MKKENSSLISQGQMKLIFLLMREASMEKEELDMLINSSTRRNSIRDLSWVQANLIIERLKKMTTKKFKNTQENYIKDLIKNLGWENENRLKGFIKKSFLKEDLTELTTKEKAKLIEALKNMIRKVDTI